MVKTFDYVHNVMKIPHSQILQQPDILLWRLRKIEPRHGFLKLLKRDQYEPKEPLYVSLSSLVKGSDAEFCENVAKASVATYNLYLKSL